MNTREYISSGIVESYVLGLATEQERAEFEQNCAQYPEVLEARIAFENSLEQAAMANAIAPAQSVKGNTWNAIQQNETKLVSIDNSKTPVKSISWMKYAVAACLILLAGSVYWNYSLYTKNQKLSSDNNSYVARIASFEQDMNVIQNPTVKMVSLKGLEAAPGALTTVYWDSTSHNVYLLINNLPTPASDKQYQIWALLDGKPIDLGLVENEYFVQQKTLLVRAQNVDKAQAFAITLEKKGGNPTPQGQMMVLGNL